MKKIIAILICASMILTGFTSFAQQTTVQSVTHKMIFNDVNESTEEGKAIYKLVDAGVINGNGDGTFTPQNGITRAEFCKMVNLVYGYREMANTQFTDVKSSDWFYEQVLIAKKAGYIQGYDDGTFKGNSNITREEFCTIISRINNLTIKGTAPKISDAVSDWAVEYVNKVITNSVSYTNGTSKNLMPLEEGNTFRATVPIKRGEVSVVLAPCYDVVNKTASFGTATIPVTPTIPTTPTTPSTGGGGGGGGGGGNTTPSVRYCNVSFETNGGTPVASKQVAVGSKVSKPTTPTKSGYIFEDWYKDASLKQKYNFDDVVNGNLTLYAKWIENANVDVTVKYTVTFNSNGGSAVSAQTVNKGDYATEKTPTKSGYEFVGWYSDVSLETEFDFSTQISSNIVLYAKWEYIPKEFAVIFYLTGGTYPDGTTNSVIQKVTEDETPEYPEEPTKNGYNFAGWYSDYGCTQEFNFSNPITKETYVYAKWTQIEVYTVTFSWYLAEYQQLSLAMDNVAKPSPKRVTENECVEYPEDPYLEYHQFVGWYVDEYGFQEYDFDEPVTSDITLYGKWEAIAEEIESANSEVYTELTKARDQLETNIGNFGSPGDAQFELISIVVEVLNAVLSKSDKYIFDKVNIYAEDPDAMLESFDMFTNGLSDDGKRSFVSNISSLDEKTYNFLLGFFKINPDEYI